MKKLAETLGFTFEKASLSDEELTEILKNVDATADNMTKLCTMLNGMCEALKKLTDAADISEEAVQKLEKIFSGMQKTFAELSKVDFKAISQTINSLSIFVITSAAVLLLGAWAARKISVSDLFKFTAMLGTFIFAVTSPFVLFKKVEKDLAQSVRAFATFMMVAAGVMIAGSLLANKLDVKEVGKFGLLLTAFMFMTLSPFVYYTSGKEGKMAMTGLKDFSMFMIISAGLLFAGSILSKKIPIGAALKFTLMLTLFMFATLWPFFYFGGSGNSETKTTKKGFLGLGKSDAKGIYKALSSKRHKNRLSDLNFIFQFVRNGIRKGLYPKSFYVN